MPQFIAKCTPSLGTVSLWWSRCTESVVWPSNTGKAIFYLRDKVGGEIAEVRNGLVDQALGYDAEVNPISHLLWIDDDVLLISPYALIQLLRHEADIVSGVYFQKMPGAPQPLIYPERCGGTDPFRPNRVYPVWGHGLGLTLVRLDVYKRMRDELQLPLDKYGRPQWHHTTKAEDNPPADDRGVIDTGHTEDLYFLDNAARLGFRPLIDTHQHAFGFHYEQRPVINRDGEWVEVGMVPFLQWRGEKHLMDFGYPDEQWRQWVNQEPIRWPTPEGEVTWN